jgi:hypothetical protein
MPCARTLNGPIEGGVEKGTGNRLGFLPEDGLEKEAVRLPRCRRGRR